MGVWGLIDAYGGSLTETLSAVPLIEFHHYHTFRVNASYPVHNLLPKKHIEAQEIACEIVQRDIQRKIAYLGSRRTCPGIQNHA